eukprot:2646677-Rhodomonas_salina.2
MHGRRRCGAVDAAAGPSRGRRLGLRLRRLGLRQTTRIENAALRPGGGRPRESARSAQPQS